MKFVAVDPGYDKCGIALMDDNGYVYEKHRVPVGHLFQRIKQIIEREPQIHTVALGNGTGYKQVLKLLHESFPEIPVEIVEEKDSTRHARRLYLCEHPLKWYLRIFPLFLFLPVVPVDEYAAIVIGERYIKSRYKIEKPGLENQDSG